MRRDRCLLDITVLPLRHLEELKLGLVTHELLLRLDQGMAPGEDDLGRLRCQLKLLQSLRLRPRRELGQIAL